MPDDVTLKEYDRPLPVNVEKVQEALKDKCKVVGVRHRLSENFVLLFLHYFAETPLNSNESINRSNWTHHVYFSIRSAAKTLYLGCTFETMGRLDAVIDSLSVFPGVILVAEWESDPSSIFDKDKELEKLWNGVQQNPESDGFLLTYCSVDKLNDFIRTVTQYWQSQINTRENPPSLFLVVIAYEQEKRSQRFIFVRSMEISLSTLFLWHDFSFVDTNEYLRSLDKQQTPFQLKRKNTV
ncbi:hypothetical protein [Levilinea saccharolytica]|uniref:hypothetical protein n=1 Tax=Levilinea saccharolytica TaxID=229921 RepID=UPI0011BE0C82|nr:hypothetical protein [Levilinea saccharolytica]GAP16643.1 hypothetical protein LSAC_00499 [Levilinea saccharolytica]